MNNSELLIYQDADRKIKLDVCLEDETVWLTQDHMAELFGKSNKTISEHIRNIFNEGGLDENVVIRKFRTTTRHGAIAGKTQTREVQYYNLDVIISVGYRVKSQQGTRFRIWADREKRAAAMAREVARKAGTSVVVFKDGIIREEPDDDLAQAGH